ncbi:MAG: hypothetical protein KBF88_15200 [Polyangiaceae bacterium]|nr:hypothetical protein [Polyangiaceae bacterium]
MDKIFSARIDDSVLRELDVATARLGMTKKAFLEHAIRLAAGSLEQSPNDEIWETAFGAWEREESAAATVAHAKSQFRRASSRLHRGSRRANVSR